jgi:glycerophosphoryl diester phosphodiesterase
MLAEARSLGLKVIPWTVSEASNLSYLVDAGVDGIITDYPDRARAVLVERGIALPPASAPR